MFLDNCPQCQKKLSPPFRSSNRQVCTSCGWSDKPSNKNTSTTDSRDDFVNNTTDINKAKTHPYYTETHDNFPVPRYNISFEDIDLSSNKIEKESKKLILALTFIQWFLVVIFVIFGASIIDSDESALGLFIVILGSISSYFSVQITIVIIKLISRIEINTRFNQNS